MVEEPVMEKWLALEMARFHRAFVSQPRSLGDLLLEAEPTATTKGGEVHRFDVVTLRRLAAVAGPLLRRRLRLPATFYVDKDLPDDARVEDEPTIELLRALGEVPPDGGLREGRLWMGHTRARLVAQRYPTAFQFVYA